MDQEQLETDLGGSDLIERGTIHDQKIRQKGVLFCFAFTMIDFTQVMLIGSQKHQKSRKIVFSEVHYLLRVTKEVKYLLRVHNKWLLLAL